MENFSPTHYIKFAPNFYHFATLSLLLVTKVWPPIFLNSKPASLLR